MNVNNKLKLLRYLITPHLAFLHSYSHAYLKSHTKTWRANYLTHMEIVGWFSCIMMLKGIQLIKLLTCDNRGPSLNSTMLSRGNSVKN